MLKRVALFFNPRAGAFIASSPEEVHRRLSALLAERGCSGEIRAFDPVRIAADLREVLASAPQAVLVAGGDGTVLTVAEHLAEHPDGHDIALGILPCGTMNVLARDLGIPDTLEAALDALLRGTSQHIDMARLNDRPFLCSSVIGLMPHLGRVRERLRGESEWRTWLRAAMQAFALLRRYPRLHVMMTVDGKRYRLRTRAVAVSNNALCAGETWLPMRERLDSGRLAVYVARDESAFDLWMLAWRLLTGRWCNDVRLRTFEGHEVEIIIPNLGMISVMSDGETSQPQTPLRYRIAARALRVLRPGAA